MHNQFDETTTNFQLWMMTFDTISIFSGLITIILIGLSFITTIAAHSIMTVSGLSLATGLAGVVLTRFYHNQL